MQANSQITHGLVTYKTEFRKAMGTSSKKMTWFDLTAMGRIDYKEIYALPRQIVQCVWKAFLWVFSRGQIPDTQNWEQGPGNWWMFQAPFHSSYLFTWSLVHFWNFYIYFQLWFLILVSLLIQTYVSYLSEIS